MTAGTRGAIHRPSSVRTVSAITLKRVSASAEMRSLTISPSLPSPMSTKPVRSVDRAVDIVLAFIESPVMGVAELQQRLDLPRPTLYRLLTALEQKGLVSWFGEPRRYRLGQKVLELGRSWQRSFNLVEISLPALERLWEACDETVMLFVPNPPHGRMLVHEIRSSKPLYYSRPVGYIAPLTNGAAGKVMLAFGPDEHVRRVSEALPENERRKLQSDIQRIRKDRYFAASGEVLPGAVSIAAPVFGHDAEVLGAVSVVGPETRMNGAVRERVLPALVKATQEISRAAGYVGA